MSLENLCTCGINFLFHVLLDSPRPKGNSLETYGWLRCRYFSNSMCLAVVRVIEQVFASYIGTKCPLLCEIICRYSPGLINASCHLLKAQHC